MAKNMPKIAKSGELASDGGLADKTGLAGRRGLIISDGIAGHESISASVANHLGLDFTVKLVRPRGLYRHLAPNGPADPRILREIASLVPPDIVLGAGRQTVPFVRACKKSGLFSVIFQSPRSVRASADLIWAPAHDRVNGPGVVSTLTPPHRFSAEALNQLRETMPGSIADMPQPRIAVLLGGPGAGFTYDGDSMKRLGRLLEKTRAWAGSYLVTSSRRTPADLLEAASRATEHSPRIIWAGEGENPYPHFLAVADLFIVTADSVNMVGEACATGRPVFVFHPPGGRAKLRLFHQALETYGAVRPLNDDLQNFTNWRYEPLHAVDTVAAEIERRWQMHHRQAER